MIKQTTEGWEERFDYFFCTFLGGVYSEDADLVQNPNEKIKSFIRQELSLQRKDLMKKIKEEMGNKAMIYEKIDNFQWHEGYNQALEDVENILK